MVIKNLENVNGKVKGDVHLVLGILDGVHKGHQALIEEATKEAKKCEGTSAVLSFHPHPTRITHPQNPVPLIMAIEIKNWLLGKKGVDAVIEQEFDYDFSQLEPEEFIELLYESIPGLAKIYVGEDFHFGRGRRGDVNMLKRMGKTLGFGVFSMKRLEYKGEPISSSRIRQALKEGRMDDVNAMLGYAYFSEEQVIEGAKRGTHDTGFPTINMPWRPECRPKHGAYAVKLKHPRTGKMLAGAGYYGIRPTLTEDIEPTLEIHLFQDPDFAGGGELYVEWYHFIQPEREYKSIFELKQCIEKAVAKAQEYFRKKP